MIHVNLKLFPIVLLDIVSPHGRRSYASEEFRQAFEEEGLSILPHEEAEELLATIKGKRDLGAVIIHLEYFAEETAEQDLKVFIEKIREINAEIPINILTSTLHLNFLHSEILKECECVMWRYDDTATFVAGRIRQQVFKYLVSLLPPFFKGLVKYTLEYKYAWHTPGHMGGVAFLKSPTGRLFYDFYGENTFRSDLSISVPELGSLLEHSGVVGEAEAYAAQVFGADETFFVTNGTSTSNKIVFMGIARAGDVALIDRNCHKSLQHALTMANVIPVYFKPNRNAYGIIGGIGKKEFNVKTIRQKIKDNPLVRDKTIQPRVAVITNSTYDGLIYQVDGIKEALLEAGVDYIHFDEAWFPYGKFHPFYQGKFAMSDSALKKQPTVFSTQSTHKLLAAFSQASMIHCKKGTGALEREIFNESFMMHTSTSPQYGIVASLDVSTRMMAGLGGQQLMSEAIAIAIAFRQEFNRVNRYDSEEENMTPTAFQGATRRVRSRAAECTQTYMSSEASTQQSCSLKGEGGWSFQLWQPEEVDSIFLAEDSRFLGDATHSDTLWCLSAKNSWHGFKDIDENHLFLDPIKVTLLTPGIDKEGQAQDFGIPAPMVSRYLIRNGVVDEKTGFYSLLFLFSIGVNRTKALTLLTQLEHFKAEFNRNAPLKKFFPTLVQEYHTRYQGMRLQDLAREMHAFLTERHAATLLMNAYDHLPEPVLTPYEAYQALISGRFCCVPLEELCGKVVLTMVAPYPPGIPIIMPGERITAKQTIILDFLKLLEGFDNAFPGFENEVHGAKIEEIAGKPDSRRYYFYCLAD